MKIRVISLKNSSSYLGKILILTIIAIILGKFFYNNRYVNYNPSIKLNSWKLSNIINTEISVFKNSSSNKNKSDFKSLISKSTYAKQLIAGELDMIKIANLQDLNYINKNADDKNIADNFAEESNKIGENSAENQNANQEIVQTNTENISEPEIRTKH